MASRRKGLHSARGRTRPERVSPRKGAHSACQKDPSNRYRLAMSQKVGSCWASGPGHPRWEPSECLDFARESFSDGGPPSIRRDCRSIRRAAGIPLIRVSMASHRSVTAPSRFADSTHRHATRIPQHRAKAAPRSSRVGRVALLSSHSPRARSDSSRAPGTSRHPHLKGLR